MEGPGTSTSSRAVLVTAMAIAELLLVSVAASASATFTWSTQADFQSGTLLNLDATSSPGQLQLASFITPWAKSTANPVLRPGSGWEADWVDSPSVLYESGTYKMWYQGCVGAVCDIGYATSPDGVAWTRFGGNPVLTANNSSWDQTLGGPVVLHDGNVYRMWYTGDGPMAIQIGYATSPDGTTWTKQGTGLNFVGRQPWDSAATSTPVVIKDGTTFVLYFSGHSGDYSYKIGRATSTDGINWTEDSSNPLMAPDVPWEESRVHPSAVVKGPSGYDMYYTGGLTVPQIGHATSTDGRSWTKDAENPVLSPGGSGSWDLAGTAVPKVVSAGSSTRIYFGGADATWGWKIGFAEYAPGSARPRYVPQGFFASGIVDSGSRNTTWDSIKWSGTVPADASIAVAVRVGNTPTVDFSWSAPSAPVLRPIPVTLSLPRARYAQVLAAIGTLNDSESPSLDEIALTYSPAAVPPAYSAFAGIPLVVLLIVVPAAAVGVTAAVLLIRRESGARRASGPAFVACVACGTLIPVTSRFCFKCGQPNRSPPGAPFPPR